MQVLTFETSAFTLRDMAKCYEQYCPVAHALDLVGERWSLLIVRELLEEGALRYSDLHARLDGCGTNILAARLKTLEQGGVIRRRRLDPPAASWVYELTEYGAGLREVLHVLAHWGARSLRPPAVTGDLEEGWLHGALRIALPSASEERRLEFRIGNEVASVIGEEIVEGSINDPDAIVSGDSPSFYRLLVERSIEDVSIEGDVDAVRTMLDALPAVPHVGADVAAADLTGS
jgi:DNA-binding HxlR family transcriptional regulator